MLLGLGYDKLRISIKLRYTSHWGAHEESHGMAIVRYMVNDTSEAKRTEPTFATRSLAG